MKKAMKTIMMLFVASTFILASCGDDTNVADVQLTLIPSATGSNFFIGDTLSVTINAKGNSDNNLKTLTVTKAITGKPTVTYMNVDLKNKTDYIGYLKDTLTSDEEGTITYSVTLTGEKGTAQTTTYVIKVSKEDFILDTDGAPIQMFGHNYDGPRFCELTSFLTYSIDTADNYDKLTNKIDLVTYYGSTNKFTLSSPDDAVMQGLYSGLSPFWTSGKARVTGLVKVGNNVTTYNNILAAGSDRLLVPFAEGKTYGKTVTNVAVNDIILFKTKEGKLGLIKITGLTGSTSADAKVEFECLVQKP